METWQRHDEDLLRYANKEGRFSLKVNARLSPLCALGGLEKQ